MDVREKLMELISDSLWSIEIACRSNPDINPASTIAANLIANGVTVQEWISVKDRLPDPFVSVLVQMPGEEPFPTVREGFISNDGIWQSAMFRREPGEVTHWQLMPQPPKGE